MSVFLFRNVIKGNECVIGKNALKINEIYVNNVSDMRRTSKYANLIYVSKPVMWKIMHTKVMSLYELPLNLKTTSSL